MIASRRNRTTLRTIRIVWMICAPCWLVAGAGQLAAQIIEARRVIGGGGGITAGALYSANGTIGQSAVGRGLASGGNSHEAGFWAWANSPDVVTDVPEGEEMRSGAFASQITIRPNPAARHTTAEFISAEAGPAEIRIVDLLGNVAMRLPAGTIEARRLYRTEIDLGEIPSGSYMVVLATPGGTHTRPLMITR